MLFRIAFRNVFRQRRRTILTVLTMTGGFTLAAISIGLAEGTYNDVINAFTRHRLGHIQMHHEGYLDNPTLYKTVDKLSDIARLLDRLSALDAWTTRIYSAGLASVNDSSAAVRIIGVDPKREEATTGFSRKVVQGNVFKAAADGPQTMLGRGLAKALEAHVGDHLVLLTQGADGSMANDLFEVVGIVDSGDELADRSDLYLTHRDAQQFLVLPDDSTHKFVMTVGRLGQVSDVSASLRHALEERGIQMVAVTPWQQFADTFYRAMKADKRGNWIMLVIILLIVAVGVLNTVLMAVLERQREYGVMKALGTRPWQIFRLVLLEVNLMAVASIGFGVVCALIANSILSQIGLTLPEPITYGGVEFHSMRAQVSAGILIAPAVTIFLAAAGAGVPPAVKALRIDPADAMRTH